jgi:hypothetical protein
MKKALIFFIIISLVFISCKSEKSDEDSKNISTYTPQINYTNSSYDNSNYNNLSPTYHEDESFKYEYRTGTTGNYLYNYDVEGSDESGNNVSGNIDIQGKYGSGTIEDEFGVEKDVDVEWTGYGTLEATDFDGNTYELNPY